MEIKLIDRDRAKCERLAEELSGILVLCGDGADKKLLINEGIDAAEGYVCATDRDEVNILHCVVAKALGARKSIAIVGREIYEDIWERLDLDAVVNPNLAVASVILRYIRYSSGIKSLSILGKIEAEMLEVTVSKNSAVANRKLKDISMPKGALAALVERGRVFVPDGSSELKPGDNVVLFVDEEISQKTAELFSSPEDAEDSANQK